MIAMRTGALEHPMHVRLSEAEGAVPSLCTQAF